jgi:hypothetical protein
MRRYKKPRKPRGIKKNGELSMDMCEGCYGFNCDPTTMSIKWKDHVHKCYKEKRCVGCGEFREECNCKSSLGARPQIIHDSNRQRAIYYDEQWDKFNKKRSEAIDKVMDFKKGK